VDNLYPSKIRQVYQQGYQQVVDNLSTGLYTGLWIRYVVINRSSGVIHSVVAVFHSPAVARVGYQQGCPHRNRCSANKCSGEQVYDEQVFALRSRGTNLRDFSARNPAGGQPYIPFCVRPISDRFIQTRSDGDRFCGVLWLKRSSTSHGGGKPSRGMRQPLGYLCLPL